MDPQDPFITCHWHNEVALEEWQTAILGQVGRVASLKITEASSYPVNFLMLHEVVGVVGLEVALVAGQGLAQLVRDVDQLVSPQNLEKQPNNC